MIQLLQIQTRVDQSRVTFRFTVLGVAYEMRKSDVVKSNKDQCISHHVQKNRESNENLIKKFKSH